MVAEVGGGSAQGARSGGPAIAEGDPAVAAFLDYLHREHGHDFRRYAKASLCRRLAHACRRLGCASLDELERLVRADRARVAELVGHLTVHVSALFRDPPYFRAVRELVVPALRREPAPRIWVAGCASGEEVLSLAILLLEEGLLERTRIYATDIDPRALDAAASGICPLDRIGAYSRNHRAAGGRSSLSEHYSVAYGRALFDRRLRERVVYADHSLATDSVFAEVQFVSCRNVLMYFERGLQDHAVAMFRDALAPGGFLGLGAKESLRVSSEAKAFEELPDSGRLYAKVR